MMPHLTVSRNKMYKSPKRCTKNVFNCDDSQALRGCHLVNFRLHLYFVALYGMCDWSFVRTEEALQSILKR